MTPTQYRQGDVLLVAIHTIPSTARRVKRDRGRVILAYGEVTGHAHAICEPGAVKLAAGIEEYLQLKEASRLVHEEHDTLELPAGNYQIIHQREYSPEEIRRVAD